MVGMQRLLSFTAAGLAFSQEHEWFVVGGGEDLQQFQLAKTGEMSAVGKQFSVGGTASWFAAPNSQCLFVKLADKDAVLPLVLGSVGEVPSALPAASSGGTNPAYAAVTPDGQMLLVADYKSEGAGVASLRVGMSDRDAGPCQLSPADFVPHNVSSVDPARQTGAHTHSFVPGADGVAYACDLGMDEIFTYEVETGSGKLTELGRTSAAPGSGPRHLVLHPSSPFAYSVQEMGQTVTAYRIGSRGLLETLQTLPLAPDGKWGTGGEVLISPDGSALFASDRGSDTITVFALKADGTMRQIQQVPAPAKPRAMSLAFSGSLLLVAGQGDSSLASFHVGDGGVLSATGYVLTEPVPSQPIALAIIPNSSSAVDVLV